MTSVCESSPHATRSIRNLRQHFEGISQQENNHFHEHNQNHTSLKLSSVAMESCHVSLRNPRLEEVCKSRSRSLSPHGRDRPRSASLDTNLAAGHNHVIETRSTDLSAELAAAVKALKNAGVAVKVEEEGEEKATDDWELERERLMLELRQCKKQKKELSQEVSDWRRGNRDLEKRVAELQCKLNDANAAKNGKERLKRWMRRQASISDLKPNQDDVMEDPLEIMRAFIESERLYLNNLTILDAHFHQPMKMLAAVKPDLLSLQQLEALFRNCSELLVLHRFLYEQLIQLPSLPPSVQLGEFFHLLERSFPSLSLYCSFIDSSKQQNLPKEQLRHLQQKQQFAQLLQHCQENCNGRTLYELLSLPAERLSEYSTHLTHFLNPRVRNLPDDGAKRADKLIRFLTNLRFELSEEKSEWDHVLEKVKLVQKLAPDRPIPLEIFNSNVQLVKQGPLNQVVDGKEVTRFCFLFSRYLAIAERACDNHFRILEPGMIPLSGAQLHKSVDVEGQPLHPDLQSGLKEDKLGFRLSVLGSDSLFFFRVAKPSEWKAWVDKVEKNIQESQKSEPQPELELVQHCPDDVGPKIAAASLEKLFQQLTSPQKFRNDFMEVFLMTHSCFTTPREILTALLNCIKGPDDAFSDTSSQGSGSVVFCMEDIADLDQLSTTSTSIYNPTSGSEPGSPVPGSPATPRRTKTAPASFPSPKLHRSNALEPGAVRKVTLRNGGVSSSDSDTSPHNSAVVVDNADGTEMESGWPDPEMGLKLSPRSQRESKASASLHGRLRNISHSSDLNLEDNELSEEEDGPTPHVSLEATSLSSRQRSLSEGGVDEEDTLKTTLEGITHSKRMALDLDETSKMLQELTESLVNFKSSEPSTGSDQPCTSATVADDDDEELPEEPHYDVLRRRRSRTLSGNYRHSVLSTVSLSEPDLTVIGVDENSPSPRSSAAEPVCIPSSPQPGQVPDRDSRFSASLSIPPSPSRSLPSSHRLLLLNSPPQKPHEEKFTASEKIRGKVGKMGKLVKRSSSSKKSDTMPSKHGNGHHRGSLTKSSTAYFGSDVTLSPSRSSKEYPKGLISQLRKRVSKKLARSTSMEAEDIERLSDQTPGTPNRRRSLLRKNSISNDMIMSISSPLPPVDEFSTTPKMRRRVSTSQSNTVGLVSKVFSILNCWQENHFEDFEEDRDLRMMLEEFLHSMVVRNSPDILEYHLAQQLLGVISSRPEPTPDSSFPALLSRVTKMDPELLLMYDWEHPGKLIVGREIDLGKCIPRDSTFLKTIAEQLTLMEFAIYAAIQRRELLNCNWKKPDKEKLAPNVCRLIRRTNNMTAWVCTEILTRETPSARATVIEHFIQIANTCYRHNDMHCALNITIALSSSSIKGLSKTWKEVDKTYRHKFEKLRENTDYQGRCKKMREKLEQITAESLQKPNGQIPSALPYIGAYLDQIYSLEMNCKTYNAEGLVNFAKMTKLSELVRTALQYQHSHFKFDPRPDVIAYITAAKRLSENALYEMSTMREPAAN